MLALYLVCLMVGGILVLVSIFAGTDADPDLAMDADVDFAMDADVDFAAEVGEAPGGQGLAAAAQFLSFRNLVFFMAFFGLTGNVLTWIQIPQAVTFIFAVGMGLFAATVSHKLITYLKKTETGQVMDMRDLEGLTAKVIVNVSKQRRGKVAVNANDQHLQLLALVADSASKDEFKFNESVTIVKVENGVAQVAGEDFIQ